MGAKNSSQRRPPSPPRWSPPPRQPSPPPPPSPLLRTPWRGTPWENSKDLLNYVKDFKPQNDTDVIRFLVCGHVGAGKSSFINSVNNVLQGRMTNSALTGSKNADQSFTRKYQTHRFPKNRGEFYPFVFNDMMGLEEGDGRGVRTEDLIMALEGNMKDGYKFNPSFSLSDDDPGYNSSKSINDKVHVLVYIHSANSPQMTPSIVEKMKEVREAASNMGIPQLVILTHIDEACGETEKNLRNVYKSKHLKKKIGDFSSTVGVPLNCIVGVKNYSDETELNPDVNTLILSALKLMIDFGDDYFEKIKALQPTPPPQPSPVLRTPWREICFGRKKQKFREYVENFHPQNEVKAVRVLLCGPVGVGKSSLINSVNSVLQGRMDFKAEASSTTTGQSVTKKYQTYKFKKNGGSFYPFVFNDIMGLEDGDGRGVTTEDIILALQGHLTDGYKFNPSSSLSEGDFGYNDSPSISDRVHVLVCIYSANASQMKPSVLQKMREIREEASRFGIPQLGILSHIDKACAETERDVKNVYTSKDLKNKMDDFSSSLEIPLDYIFPVKNYSNEADLDPDVDTLILNALKMMIDLGDN